MLGLCAPGGIRTPNDGSEDRRDIHFTTGAKENNLQIIHYFLKIAKELVK
jgi:hypothetical protein